jgi:hypothetical protein
MTEPASGPRFARTRWATSQARCRWVASLRADTTPRAHDDVTHAPAIEVVDLHALHLAGGIAGSVKSRAGVESGCAKSHASPPPAEGGITTAHGTAVPANVPMAQDKRTAGEPAVAENPAGMAAQAAAQCRGAGPARHAARSGGNAVRHDQCDAEGRQRDHCDHRSAHPISLPVFSEYPQYHAGRRGVSVIRYLTKGRKAIGNHSGTPRPRLGAGSNGCVRASASCRLSTTALHDAGALA